MLLLMDGWWEAAILVAVVVFVVVQRYLKISALGREIDQEQASNRQ
jgi:hypothetical protein